MYFRGWIHSWTCGSCPDADACWRLRVFGLVHGIGVALIIRRKRCFDKAVWLNMWLYGAEFSKDTLEF